MLLKCHNRLSYILWTFKLVLRLFMLTMMLILVVYLFHWATYACNPMMSVYISLLQYYNSNPHSQNGLYHPSNNNISRRTLSWAHSWVYISTLLSWALNKCYKCSNLIGIVLSCRLRPPNYYNSIYRVFPTRVVVGLRVILVFKVLRVMLIVCSWDHLRSWVLCWDNSSSRSSKVLFGQLGLRVILVWQPDVKLGAICGNSSMYNNLWVKQVRVVCNSSSNRYSNSTSSNRRNNLRPSWLRPSQS